MLETRRSVLAKKPSGCADPRCVSLSKPVYSSTKIPQLTTVYHSIRRGNNGRGIVKAKRSKSSERNTTLSTLIAIMNLVDVVTVGQRSGFGDLSIKLGSLGEIVQCGMRGQPYPLATLSKIG